MTHKINSEVVITCNFRTSGRDFSQGETLIVHDYRHGWIVLTNSKKEFAISVPVGYVKAISN